MQFLLSVLFIGAIYAQNASETFNTTAIPSITVVPATVAPTATAAPNPDVVIRYDFPNVWKKYEHIEVETLAIRSNGTASRNFRVTTNPTPFNVTWKCDATLSKTTCDRALALFEKAGKRIADILKITRTINVEAVFKPFCAGKNINTCEDRFVLGQASAAAAFAAQLDANSPVALFPQALIKQLSLSNYDSLRLNQYDILAEFNADFNFWYSNSGTPIASGQYDFEYVIVHELTHGLGFDTNWYDWGTLYSNLITYRALMPDFTVNSLNRVTGWAYPRVFDTFLYNSITQTNFTTSYNKIKAAYPIPVPSQAYQTFLSNMPSAAPQAYQEGQALLTAATTNGIKFTLTRNGTTARVALYCPSVYSIGSSIAHLDYSTYVQSPDFLMIPSISAFAGQTLDSIIAKNAKFGTSYGVYGATTLLMLRQMGWPTNYESDISSILIVGTPTSEATRTAAFSPLVSLTFVLVTTLLWHYL